MPLYEGLSFSSEKTPVIIELGSAFTKCGFAGENSPRAIIPSEVKRAKSGKVVKVCCYTDVDELYATLVDFIHVLYFRHLLVNHKERRVVIVESLLATSEFRETLAKVLFQHFEVLSVVFAPGHLVSLFTLGAPSGLVVDVGYSESLVVPVYEGVPLLKALQSIPVAGKAIHNYLEAKLLESANVKVDQDTTKPLSSFTNTVDEKILEDIKVRCCFVTTLERGNSICAVKQGIESAETPPPPPGVDYPMGGSKIMYVEGAVREHTCEVLFEQDNEEKSVATLLLDSILKCPIDMRRTLAENVLLMGGTTMTTGFKQRLKAELQDQLQKDKYKTNLSVKTFKFHKPPAKENYVAWLGGAIFGALEVLASRSVSREQYTQNPIIPDWCSMRETEEKEDKITAAIARKP